MPNEVRDEDRDPQTPADVDVQPTARVPETDPSLGVVVEAETEGQPKNRLVAIGDSLTHGFQSGAIFNTDLSFPALIARELGWYDEFRHPHYDGYGGLPTNIEFIVRQLENEFGSKISVWELPLAFFKARHLLDEIEDWWERGGGSHLPNITGINHNLGIYGWDVRDAMYWTADLLEKEIQAPTDQWLAQTIQNGNERAALRVLATARDDSNTALTPIGAAIELGKQGCSDAAPDAEDRGDGIETLIVFLGANNALSTVTQLKVSWTIDDEYKDPVLKNKFNVWQPSHFASEFDELVAQVKPIRARHVIWGTVPHVTIAPIARGVGTKIRPGSRYFPYYTRPWIADRDFDPADDAHLTSQQARAVDSAIDQYNNHIAARVKEARQAGLDWWLLDTAGLLDRLAARRYFDDPLARPDWWRPYPLPAALAALSPVPDSRFFSSDEDGRKTGGLFALDGVHPTTIGYGVLAQEFSRIMERAGVTFFAGDGKTPRTGPIDIDFAKLISLDTLISHPPTSLASDLRTVGWFDQKIDLLRRLFHQGRQQPAG
jgi:hypothetical protein